MSQRMSCWVPIKPVSTNSTYRVGNRRVFKTPESTAYQTAIKVMARSAMTGRKPFEGPVAVELSFFFDSRRPDLDGPCKGTIDALEGVAFLNDRQVSSLLALKNLDPENPGVRITVRELAHEPQPFRVEAEP